MTHFRKLGIWEQTGYDERASLQLLPTGQRTTFHLIAAGDCVVTTDDESVAKVTTGNRTKGTLSFNGYAPPSMQRTPARAGSFN